jgi:gamma-glutamylputrescine oxidase
VEDRIEERMHSGKPPGEGKCEDMGTSVPFNRRRFLKSAALGGGGLVAGAIGVNAMTPWVWPGRTPLEDNPSFWARSQAPPNEPLGRDLTVDVAVIGGGLTGLSSAYYIRTLSPEKSVAVLEAKGCGNGASGRNGAMVLTMTADRFMNFSDDPHMDMKIYDLTARNVRSLAQLSASTGIDCDLDTVGTLQVCNSEADVEAARTYVARAASLGMPVEYWDGKRLAAAIGSDVYLGGYFDPSGGHVNPMKLVRVFKSAAERAGASVYENTVVEHVDEGQVHVLRTRERHLVRAKSLVLACNAFAPNLGYFANSILLLREYVGMTRPLSEGELRALGWTSRAPFNDSRTEVYYFGVTQDRRVHIGGGVPQYSFNNAAPTSGDIDRHRRELRRELVRVFPALADVEFDVMWSGIIDWSLNAAPSVGHTGKYRNVFYGIGYSGHGVNLTSVFGRIIADLEAGRIGHWQQFPFVNSGFDYVPNEPFRWVAARAGVLWYTLTERK